jgi:hypothetical protein
MIPPKEHHREAQFRPQAAKSLRPFLIQFVTREFPRLGGPWVVAVFVDKLLELVDAYHVTRDRLKPGQTLWLAVAVDEHPGYRKPMTHTRQVPVVITLACQDDIADLRNNVSHTELTKRALVRAANDAFAQGGVLSCTDLSVLFHLARTRVSALIRQYEAETDEIVPRRGNIHDMGPTVSHKRIICRKAYLEGKLTPTIARETLHSPEAVDHYLLSLARVYFATVQRGMTLQETAFATQQPLSIVQQYVDLIQELALNDQQVYDRLGVQIALSDDPSAPPAANDTGPNERREQEPIAG